MTITILLWKANPAFTHNRTYPDHHDPLLLILVMSIEDTPNNFSSAILSSSGNVVTSSSTSSLASTHFEPVFDSVPMSSRLRAVLPLYIARAVAFHFSERALYAKQSPQAPAGPLSPLFMAPSPTAVLPTFSSWVPVSKEDVTNYNFLYNVTSMILSTMESRFYIPQSLFLQALVYIERLVSHPRLPFELNLELYPMTLCVAVMLADKFSSDHPFSNSRWCKEFRIDPSFFQQSEVFFLSCLDYNLSVSEEDFAKVSSFVTQCA